MRSASVRGKEAMSTKTKGRIHLIYGIALSVLILAVGVCFALSCISIYQSGNSPFTRESISTHFARISVPVYLCMAGVIGGIILSLVCPVEGGRVKSRRHPEDALRRLTERLVLSACDESEAAAIRRERKKRRWVTAVLGALAGLSLLPALAWCSNADHFSIESLNRDVRAAALLVIPCAAVALGLCVAAVLLCEASVSRETALVKAALATGKGVTAPVRKSESESRNFLSDPRILWGVRGLIAAVGALFILLGIANGGMADVLGNAIRICTECIGLG